MPLTYHFQSAPLDFRCVSPSPRSLPLRTTVSSFQASLSIRHSDSSRALKLSESNVRRIVHRFRRRRIQLKAFDDGSVDMPLLDDWGDNDDIKAFVLSSSDSDHSDGEFLLSSFNEVDLPANSNASSNDDAVNMSAHRLRAVGRRHKRDRSKDGVLLNAGLILFSVLILVYVDWCAWRIVRLPLVPFHLTRPFLISAILASCAGYVCVPLLYTLKMYQIIREEGPSVHSVKRGTPTMGGLFFVPVGVFVAKAITGSSSPEVSAAALATLAFGAIGLIDDLLILIKSHTGGLSARIRLLLEAAVGACFSFWLAIANVSSPYGMKMLVPLPAPLGLIHLGKWYLMLTSFCFVSMGNGVNLTDGLDGLAGGTSALAFIGMSIAVLPISPDISIFGASMAGACVGFLLHNRYKASVFMGDTGSLALGAALASMAACTGMFFPLFIASGIFVMEAISVIVQISYMRTTRYFWGVTRRIFRMAPIHHHFELSGVKEPIIVGTAYVMASIFSLLAAYFGLISA